MYSIPTIKRLEDKGQLVYEICNRGLIAYTQTKFSSYQTMSKDSVHNVGYNDQQPKMSLRTLVSIWYKHGA